MTTGLGRLLQRAACCDGRIVAAISMDIKNLAIIIGHEVQELCMDLSQ